MLRILACFCLATSCVPGAVVTDGSIRVFGLGYPYGVFTLSGTESGTGFTATGGWVLGSWDLEGCLRCVPGDVVGVGGTIYFGDFSQTRGSLVFGDVVDPNATWWADMTYGPYMSSFKLDGSPVLITGPGTYTAPFTLKGSLCDFISQTGAAPPDNPCRVFFPQVTGSGQAMFRIIRDDTLDGRVVLGISGGVTYTFAPEPSNAVPLAASILALAIYAKRKSRRCSLPDVDSQF